MPVCRKCGTELDPDGTCAMCLLAGGFATEDRTLTSAGPPKGSVQIDVEPSQALELDSFGPYRILRLLGQGGMGAVYLAEQAHPLKRQVALKVVKLGLDSSQILSRFSQERQVVAVMDHPNIARVYDAGASQKGRPYFVMEYVDGLPITQYCDRHRLNTRERLELFIPVCQALQHAHQKGIIHRDIKPSNIMVAEVDGKPVAKVIDFGISRATDQRGAENAAFTQLGEFVGTPEYMSPEQADLVTGDIDTSSDVYSLGVVLYELLIGAVPFDAATLRQAGLAELLRIIREEEALPMTAKLTRMGDTAGEIAGLRRTDPATLRRLVSGDLNWIVTKALEKDRQRRYPAASELAADVRRHLEDQPVSASPPSPLYRTRKFVRRHKLPVIAAAAALLALVAGIVATTREAAIARSQRAEALRQRTEAFAARALAEQRSREATSERNRAEEQTALAVRHQEAAESRLDDVHALAVSMLTEINDDVRNLPGGTKARQALIRLGTQYLNKESAASEASPLHRQELAEALIKVADSQGNPFEPTLRDLAGARQNYGRSIAMLEREVAAHSQDPHLRHLLTTAYANQAAIEQSTSARSAGFARAGKSAAVYIAQWPADPQGLRDRATILLWTDPPAAVDLRQRILAGNPKDTELRWELAETQLVLGQTLVGRNNPKALDPLQKCAALCEELGKEDPANIRYPQIRANALETMSAALLELNRIDEAEVRAREAFSIMQQLSASDPRNANSRADLSLMAFTLGQVLDKKGAFGEAIEKMSLAAAIQEEQAVRAPDNPDFPRQAAYYHRWAAEYKSHAQDFQGALEQSRKALEFDRKLKARYPSRFEFAQAVRADFEYMGSAMLGLRDRPSALQAYREALTIAKSAAAQPTAESLRGLAFAHRGLARALEALGQLDNAIAELREATDIYERLPDSQAPLSIFDQPRPAKELLSGSYADLAFIYARKPDYPNAVAASEKALPFLEADFAAHPDDTSKGTELRNLLAGFRNMYVDAGECDRAIAADQRLTSIVEQVTAYLGEFNRDRMLTRTFATSGLTLVRCGRRAEGIESVRRAVSVLDRHPMEKEPSPQYRYELANVAVLAVRGFTIARREEEAGALVNRVIPALEAMVRDNPANQSYRSVLLNFYSEAGTSFLGAGDLTRALDLEQRALKAEKAPVSPDDVLSRAERLARMGQFQLRLNRRDVAEGIWREALALYQQTARDSEQQWHADQNNQRALQVLDNAESGAARVWEDLGDLNQVLRLRRAIFARDVSIGNKTLVAAARQRAVRVVWLIEGERGDYSAFYDQGHPTREELLHDLRAGWQIRANAMAASGNPIPTHLETAGKAVEFSRQLLKAHPSAGAQLARDLIAQGDAFRAAARFSKGTEAISAYQRSRDCYVESLELFTPRVKSDIPRTVASTLITLKNNIADADERLSQLRNQSEVAAK